MIPCAIHGGEIEQGSEHFIQLTTCFQLERWTLCPDCAHSILRALEPSEHVTDRPVSRPKWSLPKESSFGVPVAPTQIDL